MNFNYKGWQVSVEKDTFTGYYTWRANGPNDELLRDREGGDLGSMANAKVEIKIWIDEYTETPFSFRMRHPELVGGLY